jgi:hypothetical protein
VVGRKPVVGGQALLCEDLPSLLNPLQLLLIGVSRELRALYPFAMAMFEKRRIRSSSQQVLISVLRDID